MVKIVDLIDYLQQFDQDTAVVLTSDDVEEPCNFVALDTALAALEE